MAAWHSWSPEALGLALEQSNHHRLHKSFVDLRGGSGSSLADEANDASDAYIENLLGSVVDESTEAEDAAMGDPTSMDAHAENPGSEESDADENDDAEIDKTAFGDRDDDDSTRPKEEVTDMFASQDSLLHSETSGNANNESEQDSAQSAMIATIPNPLFRFLLHRAGNIGHVLVIMMVLWLECLATYVPQIAHSLDWLYVTLIPRRIREPRQFRGRQGRQSRRATAMDSTTMARTGTSRRKRRELTRQADQIALLQLQQLDSNARYQHVSVEFLQRHKLGPYRTGSAEQDSGNAVGCDSSDQGLVAAVPKRSSKKEEPIDWVIQALTEDRKPGSSSGEFTSSAKTRLHPTVSLQLGSGGGVSVGLELGASSRDKYRQSVVDAVMQSPAVPVSPRTKTSAVQKTSDASGGIMGRLRAAAGSSVSRSLLGAYPGDAVPVNEAADTHGLMGLAERYGYGDLLFENEEEPWSDDDMGFVNKKQTRGRNTSRHTGSFTTAKTLPRKRASLLDKLQKTEHENSSLGSSIVGRSRRQTSKPVSRQAGLPKIEKTVPRASKVGSRPVDRLRELRESRASGTVESSD